MVAKKEIAPELLAEAKRLYEQTLAPVGDIAEMVGLSRSAFYDRVRDGGWRSRQAKPTFSLARIITAAVRGQSDLASPPASSDVAPDEPPRTAPAGPATIEDVQQQRLTIARRIMMTAEREMDAIELILKTIRPGDQLEAEHGARTLASLSRTLRDIAALNQPNAETPRDDADDDDDSDPVPRNIDEFRNELARRIEALIAAGEPRKGAGGVVGTMD